MKYTTNTCKNICSLCWGLYIRRKLEASQEFDRRKQDTEVANYLLKHFCKDFTRAVYIKHSTGSMKASHGRFEQNIPNCMKEVTWFGYV